MDKFESDGWCYSRPMPFEGDARKIVCLRESVQSGMRWIGIRVYHQRDKCWYNNNEPETAFVYAWRELPAIADGFWYDGGWRIPPKTFTETAQP